MTDSLPLTVAYVDGQRGEPPKARADRHSLIASSGLRFIGVIENVSGLQDGTIALQRG